MIAKRTPFFYGDIRFDNKLVELLDQNRAFD